jgi:nucleotide-binding universal stress UspA family protein
MDVLVHVADRAPEEPVAVAARLCKAHGGRLAGLYAFRLTALLKSLTARVRPEAWAAARDEKQHAEEAERRFRALLAREAIAGEWLTGEGDDFDLLELAARLQDIVVVGRADRNSTDFGRDISDRLVLSGHPTLVVPASGRYPVIGRRILLAWNATAQAAAALRSLRPLIPAAESVTVLLGSGREKHYGMTRLPPLDPVAYVERHGGRAAARPFEASDADAGAGILAAAEEAGADLVVMGAYGRTGFSEWILGGATRYVLENFTRPLLMAH